MNSHLNKLKKIEAGVKRLEDNCQYEKGTKDLTYYTKYS